MENIRELPAEALEAILSGPALQELARQSSIRTLAKLRKEAAAEITRLIAFLDASDPYVMTEREDQVDDGPCDTDELEVSEGDDEPGQDEEPSLGWSTGGVLGGLNDRERDDCDREDSEPLLTECV